MVRLGCLLRSVWVLAVLGTVLSVPQFAHAEDILFWDSSGVIDVTKDPYNCDRHGNTDATVAINLAITQNIGQRVIYFPTGTYKVSNTLSYPTQNSAGPVFMGQNRKTTMIKLAPGSFTTQPSGNGSNPVIRTGDGVAQNFRKGLHNLTVYVSSNNAGADGVYFYGNNTSLMSDVDIIAQDNTAGRYGLNLGYGEQGPCMVRDVYVKGFAKGVWSDALNAVTVMRITVEGQREHGIWNNNRYLWIDSLTSINSVQAVRNGMDMTIVNARLTGGSSSVTAINSMGKIFVHGIVTSGYQRAITSNNGTAPTGTTVHEWSSHGTAKLFTSSPDTSLNLPVEYPPHVPWEQDRSKWAYLETYKNTAPFQPRRPDSTAFRMALEAPGKTCVLVPSGRSYDMGGRTFTIGGDIVRLVGTAGALNNCTIIVGEGTSPVVKIERLQGFTLINRSTRTVIFESIPQSIKVEGPGKTFIIDMVGDLIVSNPNARVWGWQTNMECCQNYDAGDYNLVVNSGYVRIFGWKSESSGMKGHFRGGWTEVLGFLNYCSGNCDDVGTQPLFVIEDAANGQGASIAGVSQVTFASFIYTGMVRETRGGQTRNLMSSGNSGGTDMPLYCGYEPPTSVSRSIDRAVSSFKVTAATVGSALVVGYALPLATSVSWQVVNSQGRVVRAQPAGVAAAGTHAATCDMSAQPSGTYYLRLAAGRDVAALPVVITR